MSLNGRPASVPTTVRSLSNYWEREAGSFAVRVVCCARLLTCCFALWQDPSGLSPCSWCPGGLAMAPWASPLNCWPTASKLKSQRLTSTSMRWISNQISVLGGWTGKKVTFLNSLVADVFKQGGVLEQVESLCSLEPEMGTEAAPGSGRFGCDQVL